MRSARTVSTAVVCALAAVVGVLTVATAGAAPIATRDAPLPTRLTHLGSSQQVVVVTAHNWTTSNARLQTWQLQGTGEWQQVMAPIPARLGWAGFHRAASRLQNTGTTPAGTFALDHGFGLDRPAHVNLPYRVVDGNDWWPYDPSDPKTYNVFQSHRTDHSRWRTSWAEHLRSYARQYRYAVIISYNLPSGIERRNGQRIATVPADTTKGGGIFLHVNGSGATAGCVSIARAELRKVLRWLDPATDPLIVMGPRSVIDRM